MAGGTPPDAVHIDMQMSVLKEHSCKWLMSAYDHIRSHPDIIINGFRAGTHWAGAAIWANTCAEPGRRDSLACHVRQYCN